MIIGMNMRNAAEFQSINKQILLIGHLAVRILPSPSRHATAPLSGSGCVPFFFQATLENAGFRGFKLMEINVATAVFHVSSFPSLKLNSQST